MFEAFWYEDVIKDVVASCWLFGKIYQSLVDAKFADVEMIKITCNDELKVGLLCPKLVDVVS